jgi:hypothetical protein
MAATEGLNEQGAHPEPVGEKRGAQKECRELAHPQLAGVAVALDLLDAEIALADHELPELEEHEQGASSRRADTSGTTIQPGAAAKTEARHLRPGPDYP